MPTAVKPLLKIVFFAFLFTLVSFCFSQSAAKTRLAFAPLSPAPASQAKPQMKTETANPVEEVEAPAGSKAIFPEIVAKIDGKPVYGRDLESIVRRELSIIGNPKWDDLREDYRSGLTAQAMKVLINSKLIYQKALASGIKAGDAEVQAEMGKISKRYRSDADMNADLASRLMDRASLKESLYESLTVKKYLDEVIEKNITVTPEELGKFYAEHPKEFEHPDIVKISQIVLLGGETGDQDALAKQRAEAILARAKKGEDFAKLARENSIDVSASDGGDIGYLAKEGLNREFANMAFSLAVGDAGLIKLDANYFIIKVTDKKKQGMSTLEEVKPQLTDFLRKEKALRETSNLVNQLRLEAKVEELIPYRELIP
jgi:parvulin-like peptidyl-prolyl isomerase